MFGHAFLGRFRDESYVRSVRAAFTVQLLFLCLFNELFSLQYYSSLIVVDTASTNKGTGTVKKLNTGGYTGTLVYYYYCIYVYIYLLPQQIQK